MEKLRRWDCTKDGLCYDQILKGDYQGICDNCAPFAYYRERNKGVVGGIKKRVKRAKRWAVRKREYLLAKAKARAAAIAEEKRRLQQAQTQAEETDKEKK